MLANKTSMLTPSPRISKLSASGSERVQNSSLKAPVIFGFAIQSRCPTTLKCGDGGPRPILVNPGYTFFFRNAGPRFPFLADVKCSPKAHVGRPWLAAGLARPALVAGRICLASSCWQQAWLWQPLLVPGLAWQAFNARQVLSRG